MRPFVKILWPLVWVSADHLGLSWLVVTEESADVRWMQAGVWLSLCFKCFCCHCVLDRCTCVCMMYSGALWHAAWRRSWSQRQVVLLSSICRRRTASVARKSLQGWCFRWPGQAVCWARFASIAVSCGSGTVSLREFRKLTDIVQRLLSATWQCTFQHLFRLPHAWVIIAEKTRLNSRPLEIGHTVASVCLSVCPRSKRKASWAIAPKSVDI